MRVIVTGSSGMLGRHICKEFSRVGIDYLGLDIIDNTDEICNSRKIDLTNDFAVKSVIQEYQPDVVVHCAAFVNLQFCEDNREQAKYLHSKFLENIHEFTEGKCRIILISTDSVFDGESITPYFENDKVSPVNFYAESKLLGENFLISQVADYLIIRTNIFGYNKEGGASLFQWVYNQLQNNISLNGFTDVFFNPLYTRQLACLVAESLKKPINGILNLGSNSCISKFDFLLAIADCFGFNKDLVQPIKIESVNFEIDRPKYTCLDITKAQSIFLNNDFNLKNGLLKLKEDLKEN